MNYTETDKASRIFTTTKKHYFVSIYIQNTSNI